MEEELPISELRRLTPPFVSPSDEEDAFRYWSQQSIEAKLAATERLIRDYYSMRGIDIDRPMPKTMRRTTFAEEAVEHEAWHREADQFLLERKLMERNQK